MKRPFGLALLTTATALVLSIQIAPAQDAKTTADQRVKAALEKLGWKYEVTKDGDFKVGMKLRDGRTQVAWINSSTEKLENMEIREILSPAYRSQGPLSNEIANQLLADSSRRKLGAWQTYKSDKMHLAVFSAKISANSSPEELETSLRIVLYSADTMEKTLTGKDDF